MNKAKPLYYGFDWSTVYNPDSFKAPFKPPVPKVSDILALGRSLDILARQGYSDDDSGWDAEF